MSFWQTLVVSLNKQNFSSELPTPHPLRVPLDIAVWQFFREFFVLFDANFLFVNFVKLLYHTLF